MSDKTAIITGITGQDGSYLAELLLEKGYTVHGVRRRISTFNTERIDHLIEDENNPRCRFFTHYGDLSDSANLFRLIQEIQPDEIYNLGAQSHVKVSFDVPEYCADVDGIGTLRLLEAIRGAGLAKKTKFYQASTSELYGLVQENIQNEQTPFYPRSPYAVAKLYAFWITKNYREAYQMFAVNGILFNHESPRRPETFVTNKIVKGLIRIKRNEQQCLFMGNLDASRDWGHAKDYVIGMWEMLQVEKPDDYVLATGKTTTVRDFIEETIKQLGLTVIWQNSGLHEIGFCPELDRTIIKIDERYFRPAEVDFLHGDYTKAKQELNWEPKTSLVDLISEMIEHAS